MPTSCSRRRPAAAAARDRRDRARRAARRTAASRASRRDGRAPGRSGSGGRAPRRWPAPGARSPRRRQPASGSAQVEEHAGPQRRVGDDDLARGGLGQQRPVDEQRRQQRLGLDGRQPEAIDQALVVQPLDLVAEREELRRAAISRTPSSGLAARDLRRREPHVAADRDHVRDAFERNLDADLVDDVRDVALEQRHLQLVRVAPQVRAAAAAGPRRARRRRSDGLAARAAASGWCCRRRPRPAASRRP